MRSLWRKLSNIYIYIYSSAQKLVQRGHEMSVNSRSNSFWQNKSNHGISTYIKFNRYARTIGMTANLLLLLITLLAAFPVVNKISEASATAMASTTNLSITSGQPNLDLSLSVDGPEGTFAKTADAATFEVDTNNYTGYTLTISGSSTSLVNSAESASLSSISAIMGEKEFDVADNNGKWGYKPNYYNSVLNQSYIPAPTSAGAVLDKTTASNTGSPKEYSIDLAARVGYDTPSGTYTGSFVLAAVANPVPYAISFADTTGDTISGMPKTITGNADSVYVQLPTNLPQRNGFNFAGWCSVTPTVDANGVMSCSGVTYQASTAASTDCTTTPTPAYCVGIDQTAASNTTVLYALWDNNTYTATIRTADGISQVSLNGTTCSSSTTGCQVSGLLYNHNYTLTATLAPGYSFGSWYTDGNGTVTNATSTSTSFTVGNGNTTITPSVAMNNKNVTVNFTGRVSAVVFAANGYPTQTVTASGATVALAQGIQYTVTTYASTGYNFTSFALNNSSYGTLASTTANPTTFTPNASSSSAVLTVNTAARMYCSSSDDYCMQNATSAKCGQALMDARDGKIYTTASIVSLCWMTRNLDLPGGTTLTSSDSNVTSPYTLPASSTSGFSNNSTAFVYNSGNNGGTPCGSSTPCYSYYSYVAATAGTNPSTGEATSDICPKGWRLPTQTELTSLKSTYTTGTALVSSPFLGVYGGDYSNSTFNYGGTSGLYWSSTAYDESRAYRLGYNSGNADMYYSNKRYGFSLRCVAKS